MIECEAYYPGPGDIATQMGNVSFGPEVTHIHSITGDSATFDYDTGLWLIYKTGRRGSAMVWEEAEDQGPESYRRL